MPSSPLGVAQKIGMSDVLMGADGTSRGVHRTD
jgi:hypothetical protein